MNSTNKISIEVLDTHKGPTVVLRFINNTDNARLCIGVYSGIKGRCIALALRLIAKVAVKPPTKTNAPTQCVTQPL